MGADHRIRVGRVRSHPYLREMAASPHVYKYKHNVLVSVYTSTRYSFDSIRNRSLRADQRCPLIRHVSSEKFSSPPA